MDTKSALSLLTIVFFIAISHVVVAQNPGSYNAIYSGIPLFDQSGKNVSAHAANIVKDKNRFYLFGEAHTDTSNAFAGFNCYSSPDLYNWKFESVALPLQASGKLGPNRVGERAKVLHCPKTGEYIMLMHADTLGYTDQFIGYATSNTITGPYTFRGPILFNGKPIKKWDMGSFQDKDGSGYLLVHGGNIFKLSDDYKSITEQVYKDIAADGESPSIFRKGNTYYYLASNRTSWERNDNYYFTATNLHGPWIAGGLFAPKETLTWGSQTTFVLPIEGIKDTTYMFMGDRWSYPKQYSAATYVWQPLTVSGTSLSIPTYRDAWQIDLKTGIATISSTGKKIVDDSDQKLITYSGKWQHNTSEQATTSNSDVKGDSFSIKFNGKQIGIIGVSRPDGGYAQVTITNSKGKTILSALIDMYSKNPVTSLKFISPLLPKDNYILNVTVAGEHGNWSDKRKSLYGSKGNFVSIDKIVITE
ncbi:family 43 glycosylhydrolase [Mucilaginibacter sp. HMF5004]|uniref:family 43 glycosylhydrolase n=1 Tax=Mucilaginibacter rivuli TaxID=2857527 RepID=UPI001C5FD2BC|nr:family 43 glycosylhydrolase [Mucilaginibacter rivuli]MBW4888577.1 family 43 glycosylhydrolase [Mucilaginibacter rivuli]